MNVVTGQVDDYPIYYIEIYMGDKQDEGECFFLQKYFDKYFFGIEDKAQRHALCMELEQFRDFVSRIIADAKRAIEARFGEIEKVYTFDDGYISYYKTLYGWYFAARNKDEYVMVRIEPDR